MTGTRALRTALRNGLDVYAPGLRRVYRSLQDNRQLAEPLATPFGFTLAGLPMAADGDWEAQETAAFRELLKAADVCIDIGANVGFYSCLAAEQGKQVIAIEPLAANLNFLLKNLTDNQMDGVEVYPLALSDRPGIKRIYGCRDVASLVKGWSGAVESVYSLIPVTTLDLLVASRFSGTKIAIKMDVEGFETEVLKGAPRTLALTPKPSWMLEILLNNDAVPGGINQNFAQTFEVFWENGYRCRHVDQAGGYVGPEDVSRWVAGGRVDSDASNFLFVAEQ
jgi:FkbM family methyltransferase